MFDALLPDDMNSKMPMKNKNLITIAVFSTVFVVTAADPHESSYACYFDTMRNTFLGDVFSVMWMQDTEQVTRLYSQHPEICKKLIFSGRLGKGNFAPPI
jgi:Peptidase C13 family